MRRPPPVVAVLVGSALALAACGDDDREGSFTSESGTGTETTGTGTAPTTTPTTTTPSGRASETLRISEVEFELRPAEFRVEEPGTVEFLVSNEGGTVHALEVEGPTGEFETENIQPGDSARLRADVSQPGGYRLYCPVGDHEDRGMVGQLVVAGGPGGGGSDDDDSGGGEPGQGGSDDDTGGAAPPSGY
jgi:plastocyanin